MQMGIRAAGKNDKMLILDDVLMDKKPVYILSQSNLLAPVQRVLIIAASCGENACHVTCDLRWYMMILGEAPYLGSNLEKIPSSDLVSE